MNISLIANSGIQFFKFEATLLKEDYKNDKLKIIEELDRNRLEFWLDELILVNSENGSFAKKNQLIELGLLDPSGSLKTNKELSGVDLYYDGMEGVYDVSNIKSTLKSFSNNWIPLPFFKNNNINNDFFGPTDWVRIYFEIVDSGTDGVLKIEAVIAIDTSTSNNKSGPEIDSNPNENKYKLCQDEDLIIAYFDEVMGGEWVDDYISNLFKYDDDTPETKHIASYIHFTRILKRIQSIPNIHLLNDKGSVIDVDLVIDIGNSNTCAILFEHPNDNNFNFNKVKKLEIQDLSNPFKAYQDSFSTRVVFKNAEFGHFNPELNQNNRFQWPSPVRIGFEAERIINDAQIELNSEFETKSYNSSPKRYLWDTSSSSIEWEYHTTQGIPKPVYKKGVSEQLKSDGELCTDGIFGRTASYSRSSLMTFLYMELFCQAICQINSTDFRNSHGNYSSRRRIKRVLISCPTAMIKEEQIKLRKSAEDAISILNKYYSFYDSDKNLLTDKIEFFPNLKDLKTNYSNIEDRKDWIYDEASASQLVVLYGLIQHKYDGNAALFFNLFGKKNSISKFKDTKSVTIGSLDIGGGTSDLMITRYDYKYDKSTVILPDPIYWESFNLAGDDLLKIVIQEVIIDGEVASINEKGCSGVLKEYGKSNGVVDITEKLNGFFGVDSTNIDYKGKKMRVNFINQIGIPIALKFLHIANQNVEGKKISFKEFFPENQPTKELLTYFEKHFGFNIIDVDWILSSKKINSIITASFSKLINQISNLMYQHKCDMVILSGRPCSFDSVEQMFRSSNAVPSNRLINMNNFWIGKWYPFTDNNGYISDPKTVVTVGSLIGLMGGKLFQLNKFKIDTTFLRHKLVSNANYIGEIENHVISESLLSPEKDDATIEVNEIPFYIGFKNINANNYPSRNLYSFHFDNDGIRKSLLQKPGIDPRTIGDHLENKKTHLKSKLPFKLSISREFDEDKEKIKLEEIIDNEGEDIGKRFFSLNVQTISDSNGYWLDSGEFTLKIDTK
tara:strand:+ start:1090 stop:4122 length:3033 start_codon:yes stop_codon:yes gene_type:complete